MCVCVCLASCSQLDQGCVIPCPTAEDITKRGVPPMSPPLAMWEREPQVVELEKGESGLGFSILDYQVRHVTPRADALKIDPTEIGWRGKISLAGRMKRAPMMERKLARFFTFCENTTCQWQLDILVSFTPAEATN